MASETKRLQRSGMLGGFVRQKHAMWNHQDWLEFLGRVRGAGYTTLPEPEVGRLLEEEKARFLAPRSTTHAKKPHATQERRPSP